MFFVIVRRFVPKNGSRTPAALNFTTDACQRGIQKMSDCTLDVHPSSCRTRGATCLMAQST
eukprot:6101471-Pyramimonas_sp.AAC.1